MTIKEKKSCTLVIFGATGNLTATKLLPALYELYEKYKENITFNIIGFARRDWTNETLQKVAQDSLQKLNKKAPQNFLERISYICSHFQEDKGYVELKNIIKPEEPTIYYFSVDPSSYSVIIEKMKEHDFESFNKNKRLILEKPFGVNLKTAEELDQKLKSVFSEKELYNIDHYLGKEMVQNLFLWRKKNSLLDKVWNNQIIKSIEIILDEKEDVEDRPAFYDQTGALSDMVQNHALQVLSLIACNVEEAEKESLPKSKINFLKSLYIKEPKDVIRAQYRGYQKPTIPKNSQTETFVTLCLSSSLEEWKDVSFYIRTGKALEDKRSDIIVNFKEKGSILISLTSLTTPIKVSPPKPSFLKEKTPDTFIEANENFNEKRNLGDYAYLIYQCLAKNKDDFVSLEEIKTSWQLIDSIRSLYPNIPLERYDKTTLGPSCIYSFLPCLENKE